VSRLNDSDCDIDPAERAAAIAIRAAAVSVQNIFYYDSDVALQLPSKTREMLVRLYRGLCIGTLHYFEKEETDLVWFAPPPGIPFKKVRR
jgi:hypothetical protein